jgi:hypothetical protein
MKQRCYVHAAGLISAGLAGLSLLAQADVAAQVGPSATSNCRNIPDLVARLRCDENARPDSSSRPAPPLQFGWKLIRTPNPRGGADAVSIIRTADLTRSDPDLAGLMLRCAGTKFQVLIVVIRPLAPRAKPGVTLHVGSTITRFDASVVAPGTALLLPPAAEALARGPWHSASEANIEVEEDTGNFRGTVSLAGLGSAIAKLLASCPTNQE